MKLAFAISLAALLLSACNRKDLHGAQNKKGLAQQGESQNASPDEQDVIKPEQTEPTTDESVSIPAQVSGAPLQCQVPAVAQGKTDPSSICTILGDDSLPAPKTVKKAYIVSGKPAMWQETEFTILADGKVSVDLPHDFKISNYGIILVFDDDKVAADWMNPELSPDNFVMDGGFEVIPGPVGTVFPRAVANEESPVWKAVRTPGSKCTNPVVLLEVLSVGFDTIPRPAQGKQFVELDSACEIEMTNGHNIRLTQQLKVLPKRNYMLQFNVARRRLNLEQIQHLQVKLGDEIVYDKVITDKNWAVVKVQKKIETADILLSFEDLGTEDGDGVLIDNVQLLDLGPAL